MAITAVGEDAGLEQRSVALDLAAMPRTFDLDSRGVAALCVFALQLNGLACSSGPPAATHNRRSRSFRSREDPHVRAGPEWGLGPKADRGLRTRYSGIPVTPSSHLWHEHCVGVT